MALRTIILIAGGIIELLIMGVYVFSIYIAGRKIFEGSGTPISMSKALLSSLHVTGQLLFGVAAVVLLALLMTERVIDSQAGLPIFSALVAYLLSKSYKDIGFDQKQKPETIN